MKTKLQLVVELDIEAKNQSHYEELRDGFISDIEELMGRSNFDLDDIAISDEYDI